MTSDGSWREQASCTEQRKTGLWLDIIVLIEKDSKDNDILEECQSSKGTNRLAQGLLEASYDHQTM